VHWDGTAFTAGDIAVQGRSYYPWESKHDLYFSRMGLLADGTIWAAAISHNSDGAAWALSAGSWSPANAYTIAGDSLADHWAAGYLGHAIHVSPFGPDAANETMIGDGAVLAGRTSDLWAIAGSSARHGAYGTWDPTNALFANPADVHVAPNGDVWVTGGGAGTWQPMVARWDGSQWSRFSMPGLKASPVVASNGNDVWLANTSLWHWTGEALQELPYPATPPFSSPWYARQIVALPDGIWIFGNALQGGGAALLRYDGRSWHVVLPPAGYTPATDAPGFAGTGERDLWLVSRLTAYHYDGQSWSAPTVLPGAGQYGIRDIVARAADDVWAGLFHFDGRAWTATAPADSFGEIYSMWTGTGPDVWALTSSTGLRHWNGQTWSGPLALPTADFWFGLSASPAGDLWVVGYQGVAHGGPALP
jgi:hypothetical protein